MNVHYDYLYMKLLQKNPSQAEYLIQIELNISR